MSMAGRNLYIRFQSRTGDAMGMNMISKVSMATLCLKGYVMDSEFVRMTVMRVRNRLAVCVHLCLMI
jgi:hydroxymethylglutaryl-CoA reductase (NADPH)